MSNMSYCRFQNTLADLRDCYDAMINYDVLDLSRSELEAQEELIFLCAKIVNRFGELLGDD